MINEVIYTLYEGVLGNVEGNRHRHAARRPPIRWGRSQLADFIGLDMGRSVTEQHEI